ncbi:MAG: hypothetical protein K9H26_17915 [Prolixibacteraceae bacterium]|nr:hypothetical protein [Prolixibacteraceae bacterium]
MKTIPVLLSLFLFAINTFAQTATAPSNGDGSSDSPYQIATFENLYWLSLSDSVWDKYLIQVADIDASETADMDFDPIGNSTTNFTGSYNGKGHVIKDLYIHNSTDYGGFFGYINGADIDSLRLTDVDIHGVEDVGGFVGYASGANIQNCFITGKVDGNDTVGGFCGTVTSSTTIKLCYSTGDVDGALHSAGFAGVVANSSLVESCYSTCRVNGGIYIGGFVDGVGNYARTKYCYAAGMVSDGISTNGFGSSTVAYITTCYWDVDATGQSDSERGSGLSTAQMKQQANFPWNFTTTWDIQESYTYPSLRSLNNAPFAFADEVMVKSDFPADSLLSNDYDYETGQSALVYEIESVSNATFSNDTIHLPAGANAGDTITILYRVGESSLVDTLWGNTTKSLLLVSKSPVLVVNDTLKCYGEGKFVRPEEFSYTDPDDADSSLLYTITQLPTKGTLSLSGTTLSTGETFTQANIDSLILVYTFTGAGTTETDSLELSLTDGFSTLSDIKIHLSIEKLFAGTGSTDDPYLISSKTDLDNIRKTLSACFLQTTDIEFEDADFETGGDFYNDGHGWTPLGSSSNPFSGSYNGQGYLIKNLQINQPATNIIGLFGFVSNGLVNNLGIINAEISGNSNVGALAGYCENSEITTCYSSGTVSGNNDIIGGLIGNMLNSSLSKSYSIAEASSTDTYTGCLIGFCSASTVENCYTNGNSSGETSVGGLIGGMVSASSVIKCYAAGSVSGTTYIGGIVGSNASSTITNSYWDKDASGLSDGLGYNNNGQSVTGLTSEKMKSSANFSGWNFDATWGIVSDSTYPALRDVNNAPFVFSEHFITEAFSIAADSLIDNDYDYETGQSSLVYKIENLTNGTLENDSIHFSGEAETGDSIQINYKLGEIMGVGDTLWVKSVRSIIEMGNNPPELLNDTLYICKNTRTAWSVDTLAYDVEKNPIGFNILTQPANGTAQSSTDSLIYTPDPDYFGTDSLQLQLSDPEGSNDVWQYLYIDDIPVEINNDTLQLYSDSPGIIGADTLRFADNDNPDNQLTYTITQLPEHGSLSLSGTELLLNGNFTQADVDSAFLVYTYTGSSITAFDSCIFSLSDGRNTVHDIRLYINFEKFFEAGYGTVSQPYQVATKAQLNNVRHFPSLCYILIADIDFDASDFSSGGDFYNDGVGWQPLGNEDTHFTGYFNGQGYTISDLYINQSSDICIGLFGITVDATLSNMTLTNFDITGFYRVGGLVGFSRETEIINSSCSGSVKGTEIVGGIVGEIENSMISRCYCSVIVESTGQYGISGGLTASCDDISEINNCYSTGFVSGSDISGGLIGTCSQSDIINSYSTTYVSGQIATGGLIGNNDGDITVTNCYWNMEASGQATSDGGTGLNTTEMRNQANFTNWDFSSIWNISENTTYPFLKNIENMPMAFPDTFSNYHDDFSPITQDIIDSLIANDTDPDSPGATLTARWIGGTNIYDDTLRINYQVGCISGGETIWGGNSFAIFPYSASTIEISTYEDLKKIGRPEYPEYLLSADYRLTANIDASASAGENNGEGFLPIGSIGIPFTGTFDGNGYVISDLTINNTDKKAYIGLFGNTKGATISNLGIINAQLEANWGAAGAIIGYCDSSTVTNCYSTGNLHGLYYCGGLIGGALSSSEISNCYSAAIVSGSFSAGIIGALFDASVTDCYFSGAILFAEEAAFIIDAEDATISNCYNIGITSGFEEAGLIFANDMASVNQCYWDTISTSADSAFYIDNNNQTPQGLDNIEIKNAGTFSGWDFTNIWSIITNTSAPYLQDVNNTPMAFIDSLHSRPEDFNIMTPEIRDSLIENDIDPDETDAVLTARWLGYSNIANGYIKLAYQVGSIESGDTLWGGAAFAFFPYLDTIEISSYAELKLIGSDANYPIDGSYKLIDNIDASASQTENGGYGFRPIGNYLDGQLNTFKGNFNGNGYVIKNIFINRTDVNDLGFGAYFTGVFGLIDEAEIYDLGLENVNISGYRYSGGLVGYSMLSEISNCYTTGKVNGDMHVGGIVGGLEDSSLIENSYSTAEISCTYEEAGGLAGYSYLSTISNCYSTGNVTGDYYLGSCIGVNEEGTINGCYSTGKVTGNRYTGGFVGDNADGEIINCYATGNTSGSNYNGGFAGTNWSGSISNCYCSGSVSGTTVTGCFVGENDSGSTIDNCYWNSDVNTLTSGYGDNEGTITNCSGLATEQMKQQTNFNGFDFSTTWAIHEDQTYPALQSVNNAPFAFESTVGTNDTILFSELLTNDYDYETFQNALMLKITDSGDCTVDGDQVIISGTAASCDTFSISYRIGEERVTEGDTLWGNETTGHLLKTNNWNGTGNWDETTFWSSGSVPGNCDCIIVESGTLNLNQGAELDYLEIKSEGILNVNPSQTLEVNNSLTNNADTTGLVLASDASGTGRLVSNATGVKASVQQYFKNGQWHYFGVPVSENHRADSTFTGFYLVENNESMGEYNPWEYLSSSDVLEPGTGYGAYYNQTGNDTIITFYGTLNTGNVEVITSYTPTVEDTCGWNFIANPYPCTIDWEMADGNLNNVNDAIYVWDPTLNGGDGNYATWIDGAGTNGQNQYIAPMQGFFVKANTGAGSVTFTNAGKSTSASTFKSETINRNLLLAVYSPDGKTDETVIRIKPGATDHFDSSYDAYKLLATHSGTPQLYSTGNGCNYSVNTLPGISVEMTIPLKVLTKTNGQYTISLSELSNFGYTYPIMLYNPSTGELINLENEDYSFAATGGKTTGLQLVFTKSLTGVENTVLEDITIKRTNHQLQVSGLGKGESTIWVYNIIGQVLGKATTTSGNYMQDHLPGGVLLIRIQKGNGTINVIKVGCSSTN